MREAEVNARDDADDERDRQPRRDAMRECCVRRWKLIDLGHGFWIVRFSMRHAVPSESKISIVRKPVSFKADASSGVNSTTQTFSPRSIAARDISISWSAGASRSLTFS